MRNDTAGLNINISGYELADAILKDSDFFQDDKFGEAVKTVVREEMINDIAERLVNEADLFSGEDFADSVLSLLDHRIENAVESEIGELDFSQMIKDEMSDYDGEISELRDEVENLEKNFDRRIRMVEDENSLLKRKNKDLEDCIEEFNTKIADSRILRWLFGNP
jgi:predicted RNase H-like nuclease (RuvC/YqgF family)